jgi:hypothetical protein
MPDFHIHAPGRESLGGSCVHFKKSLDVTRSLVMKKTDEMCRNKMKWAQKIAPVKKRAFYPTETKDAFGLLSLFLLSSVAGLDACVAQADELFAVSIGLKTKFQGLFLAVFIPSTM